MKRFLLIPLVLIGLSSAAQQNQSGASGGVCIGCPSVQDGNASLGFTYSRDTCGLNYVAVSQKIGQRFTPPGPPQPVTVNVSGLPSCYVLEKAFLWADASGNGTAVTVTITNPNSVTNNYPLQIIGQDADKCWGFQGTDSYRGDVTGAISGNGAYTFSGFPTGTSGADIDGFTLMIIYRDPTATYEGHINIWDGAVVITGGVTTQTINNLSVCATSTNQRAFMQVADLQGLGATLSMNGSAPFTITEDWWNYIDQSTTAFTTVQTTSAFNVTSSGDCYNLMMMGVYYQTTTCNTCTPQQAGNISLASSGTGSCAPNSGSVTTTPTGGVPPYTYNWQPGGQTTQTVNGLAPGSYTVTVTDATGCAVAVDTVVVPPGVPPTAQFSLSPSPVAYFPGTLCMLDQTIGGTSWTWLVNGLPVSTDSAYCYPILDTTALCVTLIVQDSAGCTDSARTCVTVLGEAVIAFPNVFTPNNDGVNDLFMPQLAVNIKDLKMEIYDRWGVQIAELNVSDPNIMNSGWNGKTSKGNDATDGVYYWIATFTDMQGNTDKLSGFVHLIRGR